VRALVVDSHNAMDTSKDAVVVFRSMLASRGITVRSTQRAATPTTAGVLASTSSPTVASLVSSMLNVSQNDYAEALFRLAAKARGYRTTWAGGRYNALSVMRSSGVPIDGWVSYDGSGLSRRDRAPARTLTGLLRVIDNDATLRDIVFGSSALPIAGRTGTLVSRFTTGPTSCARGIVQAKTGSLSDVTALSGVALGLDGERRYFSVVVNGTPNTSSVRNAVDEIAATATGCS
jgi:D-alanyl-D-alanine carboxypeptidase/D-alanyl-D-alanine-endopeptidase (penicillin-binding protein 4)